MKRFVAALLIVCLCLPLCACGEETRSKSGVVLGDAIVLSVQAKGSGAGAVTDEMFELAREVFSDMDLSDGQSVLSRFNASLSTEPLEINEHIYNVLVLARKAYEASGGAFDVTSLPLSKLWKTDTEGLHALRADEDDLVGTAAKALPAIEQVRAALEYVGTDKLGFYEEGGKYYLKKSDGRVQIDLGGIAKGYFVDLCRDKAEKAGLTSCLIDLSGNLYLYGGGIKGGGDWSVGIKDPRPRLTLEEFRGYVAAVKCAGNRSFVTGGDYQRFYYYNPVGESLKSEAQLIAVCHIIDPRSGLPVGLSYDAEKGYATDYNAVCMAVVSGESSALCDAYSTAVTVLGLKEGKALLEREKLSGMIFTNPDMPYGDDYDGTTFTRTTSRGGKMTTVGEWDFIDGYDAYKTEYGYDE